MIGNVTPLNEFEEPTDSFTTANSLLALVAADPVGGRVCVVAGTTTNPGDGSLSCGASWASPNFVSSDGSSQIIPIKGPSLKVGTWRLLGDSSQGARDALSIPFTVSACLDCDTSIAQSVVDQWKAAAQEARRGISGVCTATALYSLFDSAKTAGKLIRLVREDAPAYQFVALAVGTGLGFTIAEPFSPMTFIKLGTGMIQDLSCAVRMMYDDIISDPSDPNFGQVVVPRPYVTSASGNLLIDSLSREFSDVAAFGEAQRISFERYFGAVEAGNLQASALQADAIAEFGTPLVESMRDLADGLRAFGDEADADPNENDPVTTEAKLQDTSAIYQRVRRDGFTSDELQQLQDGGLSSAEIAVVDQAFDLDIENAPVNTSYTTILHDAADRLDQAADVFNEVSLDAGAVAATIQASPNRPPEARDDSLATAANTPGTVDVLANDSDPDGDPLTVTSSTNGANGGASCTAAGSCTYTPNTRFSGSDSFTYTVSDGRGGEATGTVSLTVRPPANRPPVAVGDDLVTDEGQAGTADVLANDSDPDGDSLTVTGSTNGTNGSANCTAAGSCTYTPTEAFSGSDSFTYTVSDGRGGEATGTVSVTVRPRANRPPVVVGDDLVTDEGQAGTVEVLANDSDPDGDSLTVTGSTNGASGSVGCRATGSCTYTPNPGFSGSDSFTYTVSDGRGGEGTGTVLVTVRARANRPPVAQDDSLETQGGISAFIDVLANDSDPDGDSLTVVSSTQGLNGSVSCGAQSCTYRANGGFTGSDSFTYTISDGRGGEATATVSVTVTANQSTILPICGDQDGSEQPLVFNCADFVPAPDVQIFQVPGSGPVTVPFDFVLQGGAPNELGVLRVDDARGSIGELQPGEPGYMAAGLDASRTRVVFPHGSSPSTPDASLTFNGGDYLVFFLVQFSTLDQLRSNNPSNDLLSGPIAFFSLDALNPDGVDHVLGFNSTVADFTQFGFEDLIFGGDLDFDDVVYNVSPALRALPRVTTSKSADRSTSTAGEGNGYTITVSNASTRAITLDSISDTLPTGFSYRGGSTTGVTDKDPSVGGRTLTWSGPFTIPASGTVSLHFGVTVSSTPGEYFNEARATASGLTVPPTGPSAKVVVQGASATIVAEKQTLPDGDPAKFSFTGDAAGSIGDGERITVPNLAPGTYRTTETVPAGWDLSSIVCSDSNSSGDPGTGVATFAVESGETVRCTFTNTKRGRIVVRKVTDPAGSAQSFAFRADYEADGFSLTDGQSNDSGGLKPGRFAVGEDVPSGWDQTSATCDDGSKPETIDLAAGESVTCTFTNTQRGRAKVIKTVTGGAPTGSHTFTFQLRQGATTTQTGTTLETQVANAVNGGVLTFQAQLQPGQLYQMCEIVMPGWKSTLGTFVPNSFMPPDGHAPNPDVDNSIVCGNFTAEAGKTTTFDIDNTPPPGGRALTIGFWKNWGSCSQSQGNQKPVLDQTLASYPIASGQSTPGVFIGTLYADTCQEAVRLLNKSDVITSKKMASDPAYNLAAQLMATELNFQARAGKCAAALTAQAQAQALLTKYKFNGTGSYAKKLSAADAASANALAKSLDDYNNNRFC